MTIPTCSEGYEYKEMPLCRNTETTKDGAYRTISFSDTNVCRCQDTGCDKDWGNKGPMCWCKGCWRIHQPIPIIHL